MLVAQNFEPNDFVNILAAKAIGPAVRRIGKRSFLKQQQTEMRHSVWKNKLRSKGLGAFWLAWQMVGDELANKCAILHSPIYFLVI